MPHTTPHQHTWHRSANLLLHVPDAAGSERLAVRACTACPVAEVAIYQQRTGEGSRVLVLNRETWSVHTRPSGQVVQQVHVHRPQG